MRTCAFPLSCSACNYRSCAHNSHLSGVVEPGSENDGTCTGAPNNIYGTGRFRLCAFRHGHAELYSVRDY